MTQNKTPSILIVLTGSLGDVARGIIILSPIKKHFSESHITWLIDEKWIDFIQIHPLVDDIIVFQRSKGLKSLIHLYHDFKAHRFDVALDMQRIFKSGLFTWLSKSHRRIGFHPKNTKEVNWIFNTEYIDYFNETEPKWQHYLQFLTPLGIEIPDRISFGLSQADWQKDLPSPLHGKTQPIISILLGSSWPSKDWHFDGYKRLIQALIAQKKWQIVLLGDGSQTQLASTLKSFFSPHPLINLVAQTSLRQLTSALAHSAICIGPDSGPGHISAAVNTPYISLFGPTPPKRVAPYGCEHLVVKTDIECAPCKKKKCKLEKNLCMQNISIDDISDKVRICT